MFGRNKKAIQELREKMYMSVDTGEKRTRFLFGGSIVREPVTEQIHVTDALRQVLDHLGLEVRYIPKVAEVPSRVILDKKKRK